MAFSFKSLLCLIQALLFVVSSFSVYDSKFKLSVDRSALSLTGETDFSFDTITAQELKITDSEKKKCRDWYENNILTKTNPAYDFTVGGKKLSKNIKDWSIDIGTESEVGAYHRGGKTTFITLTHKKSQLKATVEATIYEDYATCEWVVNIENTGSENSPVIKDFYAASCGIALKKSMLYVSKGSNCAADDFELIKTPVSFLPMRFNANGGRTSSFMPYFNISSAQGGAVCAVGWTGQWLASLEQKTNEVELKAKQEYFKAYLTPNEKVRSPLVSLTFYDGDNALKGFNSFRNWESACVYTESAFPLTCTVIAGEFDRRNTSEYIEQINSYSDETCEETDFLWRDAGWYKINTDWYDSVGNWVPDESRFPNGISEWADAAEARGMKLLLWYEPERCCKDTVVYNECKKHEGWLIEQGDNINMVNLAMDGACDYLGNLVANSVKDNHVGLYRQDFNFTPLTMWQDADKTLWNGRKGIEENHYVTNLYRYLDTLLEVNPGLIIDNCASGGRRLDLEMSRRSIPLWRTDYNCSASDGTINSDAVEATQSASYGISFWLPLSGTGLNLWDNEYGERSLITPCTQRAGYRDLREIMDKNYYPLTYGGTDTTKYLAIQFGDSQNGEAFIYRRENVAESSYKLILNGLDPAKTYTLSNYDSGSIGSFSGEKLMSEGVAISINTAPKCEIILYSAD